MRIPDDMRFEREELDPQAVKRVTASQDTVLKKLQALVRIVTVIEKALGASNESVVKDFRGEGAMLGEWIAIMGPSDSGKTTMMNIIGCMDKPSLGEVILDGTDITKRSQRELTEVRRDKIGLVFQQFHLVNHLTALENVMMAQYYHSTSAKPALGR